MALFGSAKDKRPIQAWLTRLDRRLARLGKTQAALSEPIP